MAFEEIPNGIKVPFMYIETRPGASLPVSGGKRILLIGTRLAGGSVAAHIPTLITKASDAAGFFGKGSHLHRMALKAFENYALAEVYCIAVDENGAGVAASGTILVTGAATADGTLSLYVAGQKVEVAITSGDTVNDIAAAIEAAVDLATDLPVTAGVSTATVTLTARHKGLLGNDIDIRLNFKGTLAGEATPAGVAMTITQLASGTTAPLLTTAIAAMADDPYEWIICPFNDTTSLDALKVKLDNRWGALSMLYGHVFTAYNGTVAQCSAAFGSGTRNNAHESVWCYRGPAVSAGAPDPRASGAPIGTPTPPWEWCAAHTAPVAQSSSIHAAQPFQTLEAKGVDAPPTLDQWDVTDRNVLLGDGCSMSVFGADGSVRINRCISTYQLDESAEPDESYLDYNTLAQLSKINRDVKQKVTSTYPRHILVTNGTRVGASVPAASANDVKAEIIAAYLTLEGQAVVENSALFIERLTVVRDSDPGGGGDVNRLNVEFPSDLANQLRVVGLAHLFEQQYAASL